MPVSKTAALPTRVWRLKYPPASRPMNIEPIPSLDAVLPLLAACALPTADLSAASPPRFFGIRDEGRWLAVVGLELYSDVGLLRSLAVLPAFCQRGLAGELVAFVESFAAAHGIQTLFLLTTSAEAFFRQRGYAPASRQEAPPAIQATAQFSALCPSSSAFLSKQIATALPPAAGHRLDAGV